MSQILEPILVLGIPAIIGLLAVIAINLEQMNNRQRRKRGIPIRTHPDSTTSHPREH